MISPNQPPAGRGKRAAGRADDTHPSKKVYAGAQSGAFFGIPNSDPRHPDVLGIA